MIVVSLAAALLLGATSVLGAITPLLNERGKGNAPRVTVRNGSYYGLSLPNYGQDTFLGIPYAQPPVGDLRFRVPQSLNSTWVDAKNATQYSPQCIGYGSDNWVLGNYVSEDCLTLNVVRPRGLSPDAKLPVAVWIHGGGFFMGGGSDPRYNLSFIVQESVAAQQPIVGVTLNYRLAEWGFLYGKELKAAGASNLGIRDQRLALHWIQENIAAFGGDPSKVTIWGESAGGMSVAIHLYAYGGRDDGLFRAAISESGAASGSSGGNTSSWQPAYDAIVNATNCTSAPDTLACLRTIPTAQLSAVFNSSVTASVRTWPVIDGDIITQSGTDALRKDAFVKVPYLIGTNFDEGTAFSKKGINTTEQFLEAVKSNGFDDAEALTIAALYPDIPQIGIPATLKGRPPPSLVGFFGYQFKRSAAYNGDLTMQAPRRVTNQAWARNNVSSWSYHFDVVPNGVPPIIGATHFQEVAFVFYNIKGQGYENAVAVNPFANMPPTYPQLARMMSRFWISFIYELNPNKCEATEVFWPEYTLDNPENLVFDTNVSTLAYPEPDFYRAEGIAYLSERLDMASGF